MKKIKCDICDKLITANNYKKHVNLTPNLNNFLQLYDNEPKTRTL